VSGLINYNNYVAFASASKSVRITFYDEADKPLFDRIHSF
jgi:hypothetical protein